MGREYIHSRGTTQIPAVLKAIKNSTAASCAAIQGGRAVNASFAPSPYPTYRLGNRSSRTIFGCLSIPASSALPGSLLWTLHRTYPFIEYTKYAYMTKYNQLGAPLSRSSCTSRFSLLAWCRRNRIITSRMERVTAGNSLRRKPRALNSPMLLQRLKSIRRASRIITAGWRG